MNENLSVFIAFTAGLMSFFSPCVLPLIPSWLCMIVGSPLAGNNREENEQGEQRPKPVARTVSFVLGFTTVFVILSIIFSVVFFLMNNIFMYINIISGLIVILLGLNIIFNFLSFLNFEKRFFLKNKPSGIIGAFFLGCAFAAGWTPCIGPVLTGILMMASQSGGIPKAAFYLTVFSFGLGLPFIFAAFSFDQFIKYSKKLKTALPVIQKICGILLVITGLLIITGHYRLFSELAANMQWR